MNTAHRALIILLFLLLIVNLQPALPAQADIAPPEPPHGVNIQPGQEITNVRMVSERVLIDVAAQSTYETGHATVTATFQMRNLGTSDERMDVRFPLCAGKVEFDEFGCDEFHPIPDFTARVNGQPASVTNTYGMISHFENNQYKDFQVPNWANFPVIFPAGQDVTIEVRYTQLGYDIESSNNPEFSYVLWTGADWKDTIGHAEITVRLPMEINETTLWDYHPEDATVSSREIHWQKDNFEPGYSWGRIAVTVLKPSLWQKIQTERTNVAKNPNDGEAWGRLGHALKDALIVGKGYFRQGTAGEHMYQESRSAYQKAVNLLPEDADWHYGYAGLLVVNFYWRQYDPVFLQEGENAQTLLNQVVEQLNVALAINPKHSRAIELLKYLADRGYVDLSGSRAEVKILNQLSTFYPTYTPTPDHFVTPTANLSAAIQSSSTSQPAAVVVETLTPTPHATATTEIVPTARPAPLQPACGSIPASLVILLFFIVKYRR